MFDLRRDETIPGKSQYLWITLTWSGEEKWKLDLITRNQSSTVHARNSTNNLQLNMHFGQNAPVCGPLAPSGLQNIFIWPLCLPLREWGAVGWTADAVREAKSLLLCLHVVQHKAARSHCFQVWKREIRENLEKYCYCVNLLHQTAWKGWFQG